MVRRQKIRSGMILVSFFLLPAVFYYLSPYLVLESAARGIMNGSFVVFSGLFIVSLILGRAYCGWVCPAAGCQEAIMRVRDKHVLKGSWFKWVIWLPWICAILFLTVKNRSFHHIDFFYGTQLGLSISDVYGLVTYLMVLLLIALPAFVIGRRSFCHHLCWMAPFMIIGRKIRDHVHWPALQLNVRSDRCIHCHECTSNCLMSLPVEDMVAAGDMENAECILCGTCADGCEQHVISFNKSLRSTE